MKKTGSALCIAIVILLCAHHSEALFWETVRTAILGPQYVVPQSGDSVGYGIAVCIFQRNKLPYQLDCDLSTNINGTSASIYVGSPGISGYKLYDFTAINGLVPRYVQQIFTLQTVATPAGFYSVAQQETDFLDGKFYVQVTTASFQGGSLRGQLLSKNRFYARMNNLKTVPIASGATANGIALVAWEPFNPFRRATFNIAHNVRNPIGTTVRDGPPGAAGDFAFELTQFTTPVRDTQTYTYNEQEAIFSSNQNIQILSVQNPRGAIRGQFTPIDWYPINAGLTAYLNGVQQNPDVQTSARGCMIIDYNCDTRLFQYFVVHTVQQPIGAVIHAGKEEKNGQPLFQLSRGKSPIYGAKILTEQEEYIYYSLEMYVNVLSTLHPTGEIRGQINTDFQLFAYMSGSHVVPPQTTHNVGCTLIRPDPSGTGQISYRVVHSVLDAVSVQMRRGYEGMTGTLVSSFPLPSTSQITSLEGDNIELDDDDFNKLLGEPNRSTKLYMEIHQSSVFTEPAIRGQIYRMGPCQAHTDPGLSFLRPPSNTVQVLPPLGTFQVIPPFPPPPPGPPAPWSVFYEVRSVLKSNCVDHDNDPDPGKVNCNRFKNVPKAKQ